MTVSRIFRCFRLGEKNASLVEAPGGVCDRFYE
jgi:hypothetical protein